MEKDLLSQLSQEIVIMKTKEEVVNFFEAILTPKEIREIPKRLLIIKLLKSGMPQQEIAKKLKVGIATVTRGSKELAKGSFDSISPSGWRRSNSGD